MGKFAAYPDGHRLLPGDRIVVSRQGQTRSVSGAGVMDAALTREEFDDWRQRQDLVNSSLTSQIAKAIALIEDTTETPLNLLETLTLSQSSFTAGIPFAVNIIGWTVDSNITASSSDGTVLSVTGRLLSGTFLTTGTPTITLTEELAGAFNTPNPSFVVATVGTGVITGPAPTLGALTLSGPLVIGSASTGTIIGATDGSSITSNVSGLTVGSAARTYTWSGVGTAASTVNGLVETLDTATNSPRPSPLTVQQATGSGVTNADQLWVGSGTLPTELYASTRLTAASSNVRLAASTTADFAGPILGPQVATAPGTDYLTSTTHHYAKPTVTGLTPGTKYFLAVVVDGVLSSQAAARGAAWTTQTGALSYSFAHSCCAGDAASDSPPSSLTSVSNHAVFDAISDLLDSGAIRSFKNVGDIAYWNIGENDESQFHAGMNALFSQSKQARLMKSGRFGYVTSDHDYSSGGSSNHTPRPAFAGMHVKRVPMKYVAPPSDIQAPYFSEVEGRILHVYTSTRTHRSAESATDNTSKTMLGETQKAWWKTQIDYAADNGLAVWWYGDTPMLTVAFDDWTAYTTERAELANYIKSKGLGGRVVYCYGDNHRISIGSAWAADFATGGGGGIYQLGGAPLDQTPSPSGSGNYDVAEVIGGRGQFMRHDITDTGGPSIQVAFTGLRTASSTSATTTAVATYTTTIVLNKTTFAFAAHGLGTTTAAANAAWTSTISGAKTPGSRITATSSDGTTLTVNAAGTSVSGTFTTAGSKTITIREQLPSANDGVNTITVNVTASALQALTLATPADAAGLPSQYAVPNATWTAAIVGRSAGSTITATASDGTTLTVDNAASTVSGMFTTTGNKTVTLVETLTGATGSPRTSTLTNTVAVETAILYDTFTDTAGTALTAHTGEVGATWTAHGSYSGTMQTAGADAYSASSTTALAYSAASSDDVKIRARFKKYTTISGDAIGVTFRQYTGSDQMYHLRWVESGGHFQLYRRTNGANTVLALFTQAFPPGAKREVEVTITGGTGPASITVSVDGVPQIADGLTSATIVDSSPNTAGFRIGIRHGGTAVPSVTATTGVHLDYIAVY